MLALVAGEDRYGMGNHGEGLGEVHRTLESMLMGTLRQCARGESLREY